MANLPQLAIIYEDKNLTDYYPLNFYKASSNAYLGINRFEDFYSLLIGSYGVSEIAFIDGDNSLDGDIESLIKKEDGTKFDKVLFVALGYIPGIDEVEDNLSCENEKGRLLTYLDLSKKNEIPKTIKEVIKTKYANLTEPEGLLIKSLEDLLNYNKGAITICSNYAISEDELKKDLLDIKCIGNIYDLLIHKHAKIHPEVIFDSSNGVIIIDEDAEIKPFSYIQGPCYIGNNVIVEGARIMSGTSIFDDSVVSGNIDNSIIYPYSIIQPYCYIKDSIIGENTRVGSMSVFEADNKMGSFVGDYVNILSGSIINSGSKIGFACELKLNNIDFPKFLPPFIKGNQSVLQDYHIDDFIKKTEEYFSKNEFSLSEDNVEIFNKLYNYSKELREKFLNK